MNPMQKTIDMNNTLKALYKKCPNMKRLMKSYGCPSSDAEDIFQEALLIYSKKVSDPSFDLTTEPFFYVKNTCKLLWFNQIRKEGKNLKTELLENIAEYNDDWFQKEMKLQNIEKAITQIGKQCQELLKLFYSLKFSMTDIAKKLGFSNDKVAKSQKYRCISKLKDIIRSQKSLVQ